MFHLLDSEREQLIQVKEAVLNGNSTHSIKKVCQNVSVHMRKKGFPYSYAATLLAARDKIGEAIDLFEANLEDPYCFTMREYLVETKSFETQEVAFKTTSPYDVWVQSKFHRTHQPGTIKNIAQFAKGNPPPKSNGVATILDIGTGNGDLISKIVNEIISVCNLDRIHLILFDQFQAMLEASEQLCKEKIKVPVEITSVCGKIQDISNEQIKSIQNVKPIWFTNCGLSAHHMPWETKIPVLRQLREFSPFCLISELNWNTDLPEKDSPDLIYSVAAGYGYLFNDIIMSDVSEKERKLFNWSILFVDLVKILKEERPNRIDYHTTIEEWKRVGQEAGFSIKRTAPTVMAGDYPMAFFMELG